MRRLIEGKRITCEARGHDRYRRTIGLCRAVERDIGANMVSAGMAWAFTRYSSDYIQQEKAAIGACPRSARARLHEGLGLAEALTVAVPCVPLTSAAPRCAR
jgi:endonuclease YncB( thermonuclease family)